ncbi:MAG: hypothetical protein AUG51_19350 [Acidobacteria bacterium 13_1_20CM_3_53_8]|nr:MAG: hypothetical protein AUG51_19350 [Acidobacteria bacterium 13_1_20CM_3_53_8]
MAKTEGDAQTSGKSKSGPAENKSLSGPVENKEQGIRPGTREYKKRLAEGNHFDPRVPGPFGNQPPDLGAPPQAEKE